MSQVDNEKLKANPDDVSFRDLILKLREWWRYLLLKRIFILCAAMLGGVLGVTYAYLAKPVYKADLSFALEDNQSAGGGLGAAMGLASQFGIDLGGNSGGGAFSGDNLMELMKSRSMVEKTLLTTIDVKGKNQTLAELYTTFNDYRDKWKNKPGLSHIQFLPGADRSKFTLQQDSVLGVFYKSIIKDILTVSKVDKKLSIITVSVNSTNELFSNYFAEVLVEAVSDFYITTKTKKSVQNINILQHQTDSVRRELNAAINGVASSVDVNPNPNPSRQILRAPSQRRQVDVQANQAILTQLVANLEISKVSLRKETPLIQIIDSPILPLEKEKVAKSKALIIGAVISAFFAAVFLLFRKVLKNIFSDNS